MALGSFFKSIFGGGGEQAPKEGDTVEYQGYRITPQPLSQNGQFITAGFIQIDKDGETLEHHFIRADTHASFDEACTFSVTKGKQMIDQQGEHLFTARN